jgi:hypothetical protein
VAFESTTSGLPGRTSPGVGDEQHMVPVTDRPPAAPGGPRPATGRNCQLHPADMRDVLADDARRVVLADDARGVDAIPGSGS